MAVRDWICLNIFRSAVSLIVNNSQYTNRIFEEAICGLASTNGVLACLRAVFVLLFLRTMKRAGSKDACKAFCPKAITLTSMSW